MAPHLFNAIIFFPSKDFVSIPLPTKMNAADLCNIALTHTRIPIELRFYFGLSYFDKLKMCHRLRDVDIVNDCEIPHAFRKKQLYLYLKFYPADLNEMNDSSFLCMIHWFLWKDLTEGYLRCSVPLFYSLAALHSAILRETVKEWKEMDVSTSCQRGIILPSWLTELVSTENNMVDHDDDQLSSHPTTTIYQNIIDTCHNIEETCSQNPLDEFLSIATQLPLYSFQFYSLKELTVKNQQTSEATYLGLNYTGISEFHSQLDANSLSTKVILWSAVLSITANRKLLTISYKREYGETSSASLTPSFSSTSSSSPHVASLYKFNSCHDCKQCRQSMKEYWKQFKSNIDNNLTTSKNGNSSFHTPQASSRCGSTESLRLRPQRKYSFAFPRMNQSTRDDTRRLSVSNPALFHGASVSSIDSSCPSHQDTMSVKSSNHSANETIHEETVDHGQCLLQRRRELAKQLRLLEEEFCRLNEEERNILRRCSGGSTEQNSDVETDSPRLIVLNKCRGSATRQTKSTPRYVSRPSTYATQARLLLHSQSNSGSTTLHHHISKQRSHTSTPTLAMSSTDLTLDYTLKRAVRQNSTPRYNWKLVSDNGSLLAEERSLHPPSDVNSTSSSTSIVTPPLSSGESFRDHLNLFTGPLQPICEQYN